jgi:dATP/dGTP diphosphohydrolase, N-terminal
VTHDPFVVKDSGARQKFASGMQRDTDEGKTLWHLVASGPMLRRWAEHLTAGARKYTANNWMKATGPAELARFRESAFRHFMQWFSGDRDEDHAAAVMFNLNGAEYVQGRIDGAFDMEQYVASIAPQFEGVDVDEVVKVYDLPVPPKSTGPNAARTMQAPTGLKHREDTSCKATGCSVYRGGCV